MVWNTAGLVVEVATGFLVLPFLLDKLGTSTYGVWLVLGALTSYFGLLELGVRGSIGRHIALYHSKNDRTAANQTLTCGVTALLGVGLLAGLAIFLCEPLFLRSYQIPESNLSLVRTAYRIIALNFVIVLLSTAFDAALWGVQRFDWLNAVDIPVTLARLTATFLFIRSDSDIATLAVITIAMSSTNLIAKATLYFYAAPSSRIGFRYLKRSALGQLLGYGSWNMLSTLAYLSRTQFGPILIGVFLGLAFVPFFSVANRLLIAAVSALVAVTGVLTPHATALHAANQTERQRSLFLVGGRHTAALGAFLMGGLLALGGSLIQLWVGSKFSAPDLAAVGALLTVLVLGELLPSTQYATCSIIQATARHRALALFATLEALAVCGLMIALLPPFGLIGAGLAVAVPAFFARGVGPIVHGCRILDVPIHRYVTRTLVPPLLCAAVPAVLVRLASAAYSDGTWAAFLSYSAGYAILFGICYTCALNRTWLAHVSRRFLVPNRRALLPAPPATGDAENGAAIKIK
ncbi:oligosaccharide flippase family protein [Gemmata sp. G18]|uniref:Oligosaccharide flippase family protein n=1 Tax=Gemmata palustris TaxID=2822762 RepID=A0ABS5C469_9BACT|nr:oligosaccharide flippase family protein [Gemmata palustris]MBP3960693.1 oligosaccharide flippase family protein [Gemmata palustris]